MGETCGGDVDRWRIGTSLVLNSSRTPHRTIPAPCGRAPRIPAPSQRACWESCRHHGSLHAPYTSTVWTSAWRGAPSHAGVAFANVATVLFVGARCPDGSGAAVVIVITQRRRSRQGRGASRCAGCQRCCSCCSCACAERAWRILRAVAAMSAGRFEHRVGVLEGKLYAVGDGDIFSQQRRTTATDQWTAVASMPFGAQLPWPRRARAKYGRWERWLVHARRGGGVSSCHQPVDGRRRHVDQPCKPWRRCARR